MQAISEQMVQLKNTTQALNEVSAVLLSSYKAITDNSDNISRSSSGYVDQMADLNRNIGGLNTIYEIQLKNVSGQLETIDRVNRGLKDIRDMYEKICPRIFEILRGNREDGSLHEADQRRV